MKTTKTILLFAIVGLLFSCQHSEPVQQGTVQFSFNSASASATGGRKQTDQIPDGSSLIISITKSNGDSVFTWKKLELLKVGDQFITNPLPLLTGGYVITDFMIRGADNTLLFIAPKQNSPLATLVSKPVPISFSINTQTVSNVEVEVVDANHKNPEDFGYASFPIHVIPNSGFSVSTFVAGDNAHMNLTSAQAYILHGQDTILAQKLKAAINNINWNKETNTRFSLVVIKDGYARYQKAFDLDSMMSHLNGQPLAIVLKPAFTISWTPYYANDSFLSFDMYGKEGSKVYIDWGDGSSIQTIQISNGEEIHHTYSQAVKHFLSATGDLDSVVSFGMFEQIAIVDTISITSLSGLQDFTLGTFAEYQGHGIDFSHNPKLKSLSLHLSVLSIDHLDISHNPLLTSLSLEGLFLSTPALDNVIDNLSSNAVRLNTRNGFINIGDGFGGTGIIGPPSERSMRELYALINDYGWSVYPINYH